MILSLSHRFLISIASILVAVVASALLAGCNHPKHSAATETGQVKPQNAYFDWFDYEGADPSFDVPIKDTQYRNPIINGFYPDPSIVRVDSDYYMTHSTFGFYPGLPVFHSTDLVNWTQIGNAIDRPDMMSYQGIHLGQHGLYAPTIEYHQGIFYIVNTCIACGGNFVISAKDPAGPWSDPIWIGQRADLGGIDPQMFFENGRLFIVNHEGPEGPELYPGHKAIWIREVDPKTYNIIGKKKMIVDGGINHIVEQPGYVEGPHLYKVGEYYYLSAPEGGTGLDHRQTIYRARDVWGPYEPYANNPILTQRDLPENRINPITSTGHADMVQTQHGEWWAVFLGTRTFDRIHFVTGRETFMLPVTWTEDGWPVILEKGKEVPYVHERPKLPASAPSPRPIAGNFGIRSEFDGALENYWMFARIPLDNWWSLAQGQLSITPRNDTLGQRGQPSIIARRVHHMHSKSTTKIQFTPRSEGDEAGLIAFQNDAFYYAFGIGLNDKGETVLRLRQRSGKESAEHGRVLKEDTLALAEGDVLYLRANIHGPELSFSYSKDGETYKTFKDGLDTRMLGTMIAGGFTGAFVGMYAETGAN